MIMAIMISDQQADKDKTVVFEMDGRRTEYPVRELPPDFVSWNLGQRTFMLKRMLSAAGGGEAPKTGAGGFGAHLPTVVTYNPDGALFPANVATKGTGWVAKAEYLDYYLERFRTVSAQTELPADASEGRRAEATRTRIKAILEFYEDVDKIDSRCLAGLEIWPGNTSKNFARDPRVSLHFLGMPAGAHTMRYRQWQINCIWEKTEPGDKRYEFGVELRRLTLGHVGRSFVPGHIPVEQTPIAGTYPNGWILWVVEALDKGIDALRE